jgi:hypothetical protein
VTPPRQRRSGAAPATAPQIQPTFPPNPVRPVREPREEPEPRLYKVTGPKEVGGVLAPGTVWLTLTRAQEAALLASGNAEPAKEEVPEDRVPVEADPADEISSSDDESGS